MKHTAKVTLILISLFLLSQIIGLATVNKYINVEKTEEGATVIKHADTILGKQPEFTEQEKKFSAVPIIISVLIGTALIFILIKFSLGKFWKLWYLISVWITLAVSFDVYITGIIAVILALVLALLKTFRPNPYIHNLTEVFIYTGITIIILPFLNLISAFMLLIFISIYDMIAVWKSKHMIKLAKFQTESKVFAGLLINYKPDEPAPSAKKQSAKSEKTAKPSGKTAILGGGDIAFPLLFSSAVMEHLILINNLPKLTALIQSSIITLFVTISLGILFLKSEKGKFYPAMPFLSIGCIAGYLIIWIINIL